MDHKDTPSFSTQLVVPSWWVKAYEASALAESSGVGAMRLAADAGLAPALTLVELNALAMVLASVQAQILSGQSSLVIAADEHLKHASTNAKARRFAFEKLVQILAGFRLLVKNGDRFATHSLFGRDEWRGRPDGELEVAFEPAELGLELMLGVADPHWDLVRRASGKVPAAEILQKDPPLTLRRSVWLELQSVEQWLFLRLEKGIQWEFRWLQLDGVFGMGLSELFHGVPLAATGGPALSQRLKHLAKLGKKLASHGFLAKEVHEQFLALGDAAEPGVTAVWQVSRDRLAETTAETYRAAATQSLLERRQAECAADLAQIVLPLADARQLTDAARLHRELVDLRLPLPAPIGLAGSVLQLFWELTLRKARGGRHPLPAGLIEGRAASFFQDSLPMEGRLQGFAEFLGEDPDFARALREVPFASLASDATLAEPGFADLLRGSKAGPRLVAPGPVPVAPEPPAKKKAQINGALAARMLRVASEELSKLKGGHPDRYRALKRTYLESLDDGQKKLMLDVQRRMQPNMFDEHLRQRLVRYMVDNPGAWRSPSGQLAEV